MLSPVSRGAAFAVAILYAALGIILFVAPGWASASFAWNVSPLVAMTIGGWCLGNAWAAFGAALRWRLGLVVSALLYLGVFGIFETAVLVAFVERLRLEHWLGWLYLAVLAVNLAAAIIWLVDWLRHRPPLTFQARRIGPVGIGLILLFVIVVAFLGLYGLLAPEGARGLSGSIFPERMSMFSLRAFGAFYLAIALAPMLLLATRDFDLSLSHMALSWGALLFITISAFVFIEAFDFAARPLQYIYIGIYLAVAAVTGIYLLRFGPGRAPA